MHSPVEDINKTFLKVSLLSWNQKRQKIRQKIKNNIRDLYDSCIEWKSFKNTVNNNVEFKNKKMVNKKFADKKGFWTLEKINKHVIYWIINTKDIIKNMLTLS